eukprot:TRINITY_DN6591_c0_g1_i1.p1 TRINITY_DN6591_c0_g1~~TRINITY_DN6591_c0_g1_i1.p1  ORF type:complete len:535 (+),score=58.19 TRINITY_DN6591_c0_g1_i1:25-1605(+)
MGRFLKRRSRPAKFNALQVVGNRVIVIDQRQLLEDVETHELSGFPASISVDSLSVRVIQQDGTTCIPPTVNLTLDFCRPYLWNVTFVPSQSSNGLRSVQASAVEWIESEVVLNTKLGKICVPGEEVENCIAQYAKKLCFQLSPSPGPRIFEAIYTTTGLNWSGLIEVVLDEAKVATLTARAYVENNSGKDFVAGSKLCFMATKASSGQLQTRLRNDSDTDEENDTPRSPLANLVKQIDLQENSAGFDQNAVQLLVLSGDTQSTVHTAAQLVLTTHLPVNQAVSLPYCTAVNTPMTFVTAIKTSPEYPSDPSSSSRDETPTYGSAENEVWIPNTKAAGLGTFLLPSTVRVAAVNSSHPRRPARHIGEWQLPIATEGDTIRIPVKETTIRWARTSKVKVDESRGTLTEAVEIVIKTAAETQDSPVVVDECLSRWPRWEIKQSSDTFESVAGKPWLVRFSVPAPTTASPTTIQYTVVYSWAVGERGLPVEVEVTGTDPPRASDSPHPHSSSRKRAASSSRGGMFSSFFS